MADKKVKRFHGEHAIFGVRIHCTKCLTDCVPFAEVPRSSLQIAQLTEGTTIFQLNFDGLTCKCPEPDSDDWIAFGVEEI